jgi:seryl-tRNA synthetase
LSVPAAQYSATQINTKINDVQKQIGVKRKAKENADELMQQKADLEKEKKGLIEAAAEKEIVLKKKLGTIGNIVHDSVPVNNDEVKYGTRDMVCGIVKLITWVRITMRCSEHGPRKALRSRNAMSSPTTRSSPDSMATIPSEE